MTLSSPHLWFTLSVDVRSEINVIFLRTAAFDGEERINSVLLSCVTGEYYLWSICSVKMIYFFIRQQFSGQTLKFDSAFNSCEDYIFPYKREGNSIHRGHCTYCQLFQNHCKNIGLEPKFEAFFSFSVVFWASYFLSNIS